MGMNIAGLLLRKGPDNEQQLEALLESKLTFLEAVDFEEATSSFRDENTVDILETDTGTLLITALGQLYNLENTQLDAIQFMISDVSDTYYFERFAGGQLLRKYITSEGETAEDSGEGFVTEDEDLTDKIWEFAGEFLQIDFGETMFDLTFKRYKLG